MKETTLKIDGMMCGMCESHVADAIKRKFKVKKIIASHADNTAVIISEQPLDELKVRAAIEGAGYRLIDFSEKDYLKKGLFSFLRKRK